MFVGHRDGEGRQLHWGDSSTHAHMYTHQMPASKSGTRNLEKYAAVEKQSVADCLALAFV